MYQAGSVLSRRQSTIVHYYTRPALSIAGYGLRQSKLPVSLFVGNMWAVSKIKVQILFDAFWSSYMARSQALTSLVYVYELAEAQIASKHYAHFYMILLVWVVVLSVAGVKRSPLDTFTKGHPMSSQGCIAIPDGSVRGCGSTLCIIIHL